MIDPIINSPNVREADPIDLVHDITKLCDGADGIVWCYA